MISGSQSTRPIRAVLDDCLARVAKIDPAVQLDAVQRILVRVSSLKPGLAPALSGITSGKQLVAAMAEDDPSKRSLALLVLAELEPGLVAQLFDEIEAIYKAEAALAVERCLRALPEAIVSALASGRKLERTNGPAAIAALLERYDLGMHYAISDKISKLDDTSESQRLSALLTPPAEIATPAWMVNSGLRSDAEQRAQGFPAFLARARANKLSWETTTLLAAREEVATTAGRLALLTSVADEVSGHDMERVVKWLIDRLADAKDKQVDPLLAKILRDHPDLDRGIAAVEALARRTGAIARAALLARIAASECSEPSERDVRYAFLAARGLVHTEPTDIDGIARHLTPAAVVRPVGGAVARAALMVVAGLATKKRSPVLRAWAAIAMPLLRGPLDDAARGLLNHVPEAELRAMLPAPPKPVRVTAPNNPRWLARYEGGEHEAVWREMRESGAEALAIEDAQRVTEATMNRVKRDIERAITALRELAYPFADEPLVGSGRPSAKELAAIEKTIGAPLPLSFRVFHEIVGTVDLRRDHTLGVITHLDDLQWSDPLQVAPLAITRDFLATAHKASKRTWVEALRLPERLMIGMSPSRKGDPDQEDDGCYELEVFGHPIDGVVYLQGRVVGSFVDFLRATLRHGGFAALDRPENGAELRAKLTAGHIGF